MAMTEVKPRELPPTTWLDRAVMFLAPEWGARRIATRRAFSHAEHKFARIESAEHNETRGDRWLISRLSPDSQLEQDHQTLRDRSRDIYQNDIMGGAIDGKVNHTIGTGHTPQARIKAENGISEEEAEAYNEQMESVYERWQPKADRSGTRSLWMCSRIAARHNEFDGESITILSDVGRTDKPVPLAIQVIDTERLNTPPKFAGDRQVRLGIRYANDGEILGYYIQKTHPGDTKTFSHEYDFVPADRVLHVFEPWFAEQSRGLPWMTRALNRARDAKDYDEATILGAQIEQCYAGFVKPAVGTGYLSATAATAATTSSGRRLQDITPGTISHLDPGEEVTFSNPSKPGNNFAPFMEWNYRRVSAAINWPYEMVVKNWNGLSFAAGRLVLTDAKKATKVGQKMMREMWFTKIWNRLVEESVIVGEVDIDPRLYLQFPETFNRHVWIAPEWEYALNPGEEVAADINEITANLCTLEDKLGKRGYDLEELIARRKREKQLLKDAGLTEPIPNTMQTPQQTNPNQNPDGTPKEPVDDSLPVGAAA